MSRIRTVVVGAGHLGKFHAGKLKGLPEFELVGIVDPSEAARAAAAEQFGVPTTPDHRTWLGQVDAVVVASPTTHHRRVTSEFLETGAHALVEKPLTSTAAEAEELVECALLRRRVLQVGHVERFNPAFEAVKPLCVAPRYIECLREGPFSFRSTDIGVVLDLMIHDIDLTLALAGSPLVSVDAVGQSILGRREDVVHARLRFADGCIAQLHASRAASSAARQLKVQSAERLVSVDLNARTATITHIDPRLVRGQVDVEKLDGAAKLKMKESLATEWLRVEKTEVPARDALTAELQDFAEAVQTGRRPRVSGVDGLEAVRVAEQILEALHQDEERPTREASRPAILPGPHWHRTGVDAGLRDAG
ncbi:MAG: Gfo/Idh/MocA family oxidoreductase [Pirellulales bacterium]